MSEVPLYTPALRGMHQAFSGLTGKLYNKLFNCTANGTTLRLHNLIIPYFYTIATHWQLNHARGYLGSQGTSGGKVVWRPKFMSPDTHHVRSFGCGSWCTGVPHL